VTQATRVRFPAKANLMFVLRGALLKDRDVPGQVSLYIYTISFYIRVKNIRINFRIIVVLLTLIYYLNFIPNTVLIRGTIFLSLAMCRSGYWYSAWRTRWRSILLTLPGTPFRESNIINESNRSLFPLRLIDRFAVSRFLGSHVGREHINLLVLDFSLVVDRSISRSLTFLGCHVGREHFNLLLLDISSLVVD
jgi:hypothetical protein